MQRLSQSAKFHDYYTFPSTTTYPKPYPYTQPTTFPALMHALVPLTPTSCMSSIPRTLFLFPKPHAPTPLAGHSLGAEAHVYLNGEDPGPATNYAVDRITHYPLPTTRFNFITSSHGIQTLRAHGRNGNRTRLLNLRPRRMRLRRRSQPVLRIQQLNIHTPIRSTRAAAIAPKEAEFIRTHNPLPFTSRRARVALAFIAPVIGRAVVGDDPGAEGGETGDDDGDGLLDGAPGADPGGGGGAAPGGVEDEADDGEDGYDKGEGEDAGEGEFLFAWDAGFEREGDGDYGYCLRGSVSLGCEGERELG